MTKESWFLNKNNAWLYFWLYDECYRKHPRLSMDLTLSVVAGRRLEAPVLHPSPSCFCLFEWSNHPTGKSFCSHLCFFFGPIIHPLNGGILHGDISADFVILYCCSLPSLLSIYTCACMRSETRAVPPNVEGLPHNKARSIPTTIAKCDNLSICDQKKDISDLKFHNVNISSKNMLHLYKWNRNEQSC